jgi:intermediate peptidase
VHFVDLNGNRTGDETFTTSKQPQPPTTFRQLPSVALVTNFGGEHSRFGDTNLSHAELETFLHELGHAVHSVLSTTKYQHLSGTRCASDLVEVPSHVFEYFAWDADALKLLSGHVTTGESIPDELITQLKKGKELFAASDLRQQLMFASVDLETHALGLGDNELSSSGSITSETIRDIAGRISHEMGQNSLTDYSHDTNPEKDAAWELRFGHVVGYASSYYR